MILFLVTCGSGWLCCYHLLPNDAAAIPGDCAFRTGRPSPASSTFCELASPGATFPPRPWAVVGVLVKVLNEVRMNVLSRVFVCGLGQVDTCDDRGVESPDSLFRRRLLLESLTVLAADAQSQVAWLAKHDVVPDEIALDFDHAFGVAEALVEEGQLGRGVLPGLREIDALLSEMSGAENAGRWTRDALSIDEGWIQARRLARRVLVAELGEWQQPLPEISVMR